jgi:drug/metabolite transporter (DMT)-like permease
MTDATLETQPSRRWIGSVGAILAGFFVVVILSIGTDLILHQTGVFPALGQPMGDALSLLATVYRTAYAVAGSYVTARLAPSRPMLHALVGGAIGLLLSTVGAVVTWNRGPEFGPHWYPLALVVTAMPSAWLGGKLRLLQMYKHVA